MGVFVCLFVWVGVYVWCACVCVCLSARVSACVCWGGGDRQTDRHNYSNKVLSWRIGSLRFAMHELCKLHD